MSVKLFLISLLLLFVSSSAFAENTNLKPKYGTSAKTATEKEADAKFIATIDGLYKGDRTKASEDLADRGWQFLRQGKVEDAMRRFNQAWLLSNSNGKALWGMAAIQSASGKPHEALQLFTEASATQAKDLDFAVDHAKAIGFAGAQLQNKVLIDDALARFEKIYKQAPAHPQNLQNWAITLFYTGNYPGALEKVKLAQAANLQLDPGFIAALKAKMQ